MEGSPNTGIEKLDEFIPVSEEHQTKTKKLATQSMVKAKLRIRNAPFWKTLNPCESSFVIKNIITIIIIGLHYF